MKLIQIAAFVFLFLVVTIPDQTDAAVPKSWVKNVASQLGGKPRKNYYYARCNTRELLLRYAALKLFMARAGHVI